MSKKGDAGPPTALEGAAQKLTALKVAMQDLKKALDRKGVRWIRECVARCRLQKAEVEKVADLLDQGVVAETFSDLLEGESMAVALAAQYFDEKIKDVEGLLGIEKGREAPAPENAVPLPITGGEAETGSAPVPEGGESGRNSSEASNEARTDKDRTEDTMTSRGGSSSSVPPGGPGEGAGVEGGPPVPATSPAAPPPKGQKRPGAVCPSGKGSGQGSQPGWRQE